jgi:hypothetical protein
VNWLEVDIPVLSANECSMNAIRIRDLLLGMIPGVMLPVSTLSGQGAREAPALTPPMGWNSCACYGADDCSYPYHATEIEQIRFAIDNCGREMVLSLSPGPTPIAFAGHLKENAQMWRISPDLFDLWKNPIEFTGLSPVTGKPTADVIDIWVKDPHRSDGSLYYAFDLFDRWSSHAGPGHWPDGDLLVLGRIGMRSGGYGTPEGKNRFTQDEQRTLMTLWCMARSPLMFRLMAHSY